MFPEVNQYHAISSKNNNIMNLRKTIKEWFDNLVNPTIGEAPSPQFRVCFKYKKRFSIFGSWFTIKGKWIDNEQIAREAAEELNQKYQDKKYWVERQ